MQHNQSVPEMNNDLEKVISFLNSFKNELSTYSEQNPSNSNINITNKVN